MTMYKLPTLSTIERAILLDRSYVGLNSNVYQFPKWHVAAWKSDGSVTLADAMDESLQKVLGVSNEDIPSGSSGIFVQRGVITNAIATLGAQPGAKIYLSTVAGELTKIAPTDPGAAVIQIGFAETNPSTGLVTDLRIELAISSISGGTGVTPDDVAQAIADDHTVSHQNGSGVAIAALRAVAWMDDHKIQAADASTLSKCDVVGITKVSFSSASYGAIQFSGIVPDACLSLSATPGQAVFLASGPGGNLTLTPPSGTGDSIVRIGFAVPKNGTTGNPVDLLLDISILFEP